VWSVGWETGNIDMGKKSKLSRRLEHKEIRKPSALGRPWKILGGSALTLFVCLLAYGSSMQFGLTGLDDDSLVSIFTKQYPFADAFNRDAFMVEKSNTFYRPLQSLTFMAESYIWGSYPPSYHRANVILHCLAACCLLQLLILLGYPQTTSLLATLVYATSPLFAQAVAWIPGCGDLLLGLFGLLSFLSLVKFHTTGKRRYWILHFLSLSLAAFSKETALALPVIFAAYLLLVERKRVLSIRNLGLAATWFTVSVAYFFIRRNAMAGLPGSHSFGIGCLMENLRVLPETVGSFIFPFNISVLPSFSLRLTLIGLVVIIAIAAAIWVQEKQGRPMVIFGFLWFIFLSIPGMMYSQPFGGYGYNYLNHRTYLPMIGILLILIEAVPDAWLAQRQKELHVIGGVVVALLCILAYRQSTSFADTTAFYDQAVQTNPKSAFALNYRGKFKVDAGNFRSALIDYDNALRLYPNYPLAYSNRGLAKGSLGDVSGAIDDFNKAIALDPGNAIYYGNRGRWEELGGKTDAALADYSQAIAIRPHFAGFYNNRGALKAKANDLDGAEADFVAALARDPQLADVMYNLGLIRIRRGDRSGACSALLNAAQLQNESAHKAYQQFCR
jgi:tetratricopeptide (TPR) repeat protein